MRKYEEEFNEDYERGYETGRREALRDLRESEKMDSIVKKIESIVKKYKNNLEDMSYYYNKGKIIISQRNNYPVFKITLEESSFKPGRFVMDADMDDVAGSGNKYALNTHITESSNFSPQIYIDVCKDIIAYYKMVDEILKLIKK